MNLLIFSSELFKFQFFSEKLNQCFVNRSPQINSVNDINIYLCQNLGFSSCNLIEENYTSFFKKTFDGQVYTLRNPGKFHVQYINDHFDYAAIAFSSPITEKNIKSLERFYTEQFFEFVENLKFPFVIVDLYIENQNILKHESKTLSRVVKLLQKAKAVITIDDDSKRYLTDFGLKNVESKGYIGFYLNHKNVYKSIESLQNIKYSKVATSSVCALNEKCEITKLGISFINDLIKKNNLKDLSVIFKDELFSLDSSNRYSSELYDEENNKFNESFIQTIKEINTIDDVNLSIYLFLNLQVWQQALGKCDLFVSNFLKTAIIAMQAGIPVIFVDPTDRFSRYLNKFGFPTFKEIPVFSKVDIDVDQIKTCKEKYQDSYEKSKIFFKSMFSEVNSKVLILQDSNQTAPNRYPLIFGYFLDNHINDKKMVLSFGCSVGDEVFSLDSYFKNSTIVGVDISDEMIEIASGRLKTYKSKNNNKICFYNSQNLENSDQKFDVIFVMGVLCKWGITNSTENKTNISKIFPYDNYFKAIMQINSLLNKNGYLVIYNANYSFENTIFYKLYRKLNTPNFNSGYVHRYNNDGSRDMCEDHGTIFIKER